MSEGKQMCPKQNNFSSLNLPTYIINRVQTSTTVFETAKIIPINWLLIIYNYYVVSTKNYEMSRNRVINNLRLL